MPNNIVFSNPGGSVIRWGNGAATPYLTLSGLPSTGTVGVAVSGLVTNPSAATATWTVSSSPADAIITPSSGTLAPGVAVAFTLTALASGLKNVQLTSTTPNTIISGSPHSFTAASVAPPPPPPAPAASALTLSMASTGTTGSATLVTVTPNAAIGATGTATLSVSGGGTLGTSTLNFTAGSSAAQSTTLTRTTDGTTTLTMTNNMGLSNLGSPASYGSTSAASTGTPQPFTLTSASSGILPFAIGYAMSQGHVPAGQSLSFSGATAKLTVLSTWPDGSARHGIIAGTYTSAGSAVTVTPTVATVTAGTALTGAAVQTAMGSNTAAFDAGAFGSATFSGADFATPFVTHAATDTFIEAIYRKQIGSDAHLVAWLSLSVWASGQVEALPWIENGYLTVAGPTNKSATYTFTLGGTSRFSAAIDLKHHTRTPLVSGSLLSHWLGTDPGVTPLHDAAYLQTTELVPTYAGVVPASASVITALPSTYTPLQAGSLSYSADDMSSTGYQAPIGLLPEHDVLHLVAESSARAATYAAVVRNGYSAGRYGIHFRDAVTNRVPRLTDYQTLVLRDNAGVRDSGASTTGTYSPTVSGGNAPQWDTSHSPSVGYMAYLLTGRYFHLETTLFAHVTNHFNTTDWARGGGRGSPSYTPLAGYTGASGVCVTNVQTRYGAWWFRSLIQALSIIPDNDATGVRADLIAAVQANCLYYSTYYNNTVNNPFGIVEPGSSEIYDVGDGLSRVSMFQQDFITAVWGWAKSMQLPIGTTASTQLSDFFAWKAQSVVGRLATNASYWYINAATYTLRISSSTTLTPQHFFDGTGAWAADWATVYSLTNTPPPAWLGSTEGTLVSEFFPETGAGLDPAMWHNMQPAISYAVRHGVSGASAAYGRIKAATNWSALAAGFHLRPGWGMKPLVDPLATPAWLVGAVAHQVVQISGTSGAGGAALNAWGTLPLIEGTATLVSPANGGHNDSADNRVTSIDLLQAAPSWTLQIAASSPGDVVANASYYIDGKPVSRHGYHHAHYISQRNRLMLFGSRGWYSNGGDGFAVDGHSVSGTWAWDAAATWASSSGGQGYGAAHDPVTGNVWASSSGWRWNQATNTWTQPTGGAFPTSWRWPAAYDSSRGKFFTLQYGDGQGFDLGRGVVATQFDRLTGSQVVITFNASAALTQFQTDQPVYAGMDYDPINDRFLFYSGIGAQAGRIFVVTPNAGTTWDMSILSMTGATLPASPGAGINGRIRYIPALSGFAIAPSVTDNIYFFKVA